MEDLHFTTKLHGKDAGIDLLKKMLEINPSKRISAQDALKHPWFIEENDYETKLSKLNFNLFNSPYFCAKKSISL